MDKIEKECVDYFKQGPVWEKVFKGFYGKYESYGYFAGTVKLTNLKGKDIEALEGFFCRNYHGQKSVSISADRFKTALLKSRFESVTPERLLEVYFDKKPVGKKEQRELLRGRKESIAEELIIRYAGTPAGECIGDITRIVKWDKNTKLDEWKKLLILAADIINSLPYRDGRAMYLAVYATIVTGNPHAFDMGTDGGKLLASVIQYDLKNRGIDVRESQAFHSYKRQKSYLETGIMIDDISNYAMLCGIRAWKQHVHQGMEGFYEENDPVIVPLSVVVKWDRIWCPDNTIYIVENPSVYAMLCSRSDNNAYMCMNGQPRLASLIVMELLAKCGVTVYYAGDFDPEGLLIAEKLASYYEGEFHYWHMSKEDYELCRSEQGISQKRLKMLENITDERLLPVAGEIAMCKKAGYQEKLSNHFLTIE